MKVCCRNCHVTIHWGLYCRDCADMVVKTVLSELVIVAIVGGWRWLSR